MPRNTAHTEPSLTGRALQPLVSGLRALGHDPRPLLKSSAMDDTVLADPDARVGARAVSAFLTAAAQATVDPDLGLHLAEHAELRSADVHFYAMTSSPTLRAAFERLCRYQRLIHETNQVELEVEGPRARLRHRRPGGLPAPRIVAEFLLAMWVRAGRLATNTLWAPLEVRFAHPAPKTGTAEHARIFQAPVYFSCGENALVVPATLLDTPCVGADPGLLALLDRYAADRLAHSPQTSTLADRVRATLASHLTGPLPTLAEVAIQLGMSARTLTRRLSTEGATFRDLVDGLRHELAARHLAERRLSIVEVAFLLGFSELSAFHRAFRRWTGQTPAAFRTAHRKRPR